MPIDSLGSLHLNLAMTVEHSMIPPYLCALYLIPNGANEEAASAIQTEVMEEMLHIVLVANLTNALGGTIRANDREFGPNISPPPAARIRCPCETSAVFTCSIRILHED